MRSKTKINTNKAVNLLIFVPLITSILLIINSMFLYSEIYQIKSELSSIIETVKTIKECHNNMDISMSTIGKDNHIFKIWLLEKEHGLFSNLAEMVKSKKSISGPELYEQLQKEILEIKKQIEILKKG